MDVLVFLSTGQIRVEADNYAWGTAESRVAWDARQSQLARPQPYLNQMAVLHVPDVPAETMPRDSDRLPIVDTSGLSLGDDLTLDLIEWGAISGKL